MVKGWLSTHKVLYRVRESVLRSMRGARHRPSFASDAGGLRSAHAEPVQFERDGLYLLHKEGHYLLGQSPLALIWKDASCCRFLLDTDLNGKPLQYQVLAWLHTSVPFSLQGLALGIWQPWHLQVLAAARGCLL